MSVYVAVMCLTGTGSSAGAMDIVDIDSDIDGLTAAALRETYDYHLEAAGRLIVSSRGTSLRSSDLSRLAHRWAKATVARMEYTHRDGGRTRTWIYHAISGHDASDVLSIRGGMADMYVVSSVHRPALADLDADSILADPVQGHLLDAEAKVLRAAERDIARGALPSSGSAKIWVTQPACSSCRAVAESFESSFDAPVTVYQWKHLPPGEADAPFAKLAAHRKRGVVRLKAWRRQGALGSIPVASESQPLCVL